MERAMSGYDIKKHVQRSLNAATSASYGTLYPMLHRLLDEGAVEMQEVPQQTRPAKKLYSITQRGRNDLLEWLQQPPSADQIKREFLLKLYLADSLSDDQLRKLLAMRRSEIQAQLAMLRRERHSRQKASRKWVIEYALSQYEAEISWLDQLEGEIEKGS